jgi:hypothetical protein
MVFSEDEVAPQKLTTFWATFLSKFITFSPKLAVSKMVCSRYFKVLKVV